MELTGMERLKYIVSGLIERGLMERFDVDEFGFDVLLVVLQKGKALQHDIEEFLKPYGISHGRFSILLTLYSFDDGCASPSLLADRLKKKRPTITGMLKKLVSDGMVSEINDPVDGRKKHIRIEQQGLLLLSEIIPIYNKRIVHFGSGLTIEEKEKMRQLVQKIKV